MANRNTGSTKKQQGKKNPVKAAKKAQSRPTAFYIVLALVAVAGIGALAYVLAKPKPRAQEVTVSTDTANAGASHGYSFGKTDAPVQILEFGDFECPQCARFATLTEPDLRKRLVGTGQVSFTFYDFPIPEIHRNTEAASNAAACADEQGKFWEMHDRIFDSQDRWNGEATDQPGKIFAELAAGIGLNVPSWQQCFDARKYQKRINANLAEGLRRGVNATPSFIIDNRLHTGSMGYDELKAVVDSARGSAATPVGKIPATAPPKK